MELFTLDPGLVIWTWVSFGILFFILSKFVFPPLMENLKNREKTIAKSIDDAAAIEKRLEEIEIEREELLKETNARADELLMKTRSDAEQLKQSLLEKAEKEASAVLEQARKKAVAEREALLRAMQDELADLVCDASEKVIGKAFIGEKEREYSRELVKEL
jgi:F-type H+-transporting ATPase subunit b